MKTTIFSFLFFAFSVNAFCQETNLIFTKVINTENIGKEGIYAKVKEWFATTYKSSKDVIQMDDKDVGIITGKAIVEYSHEGVGYTCYGGYINYDIKVQMKDDRIKVELTNFVHRVAVGHGDACNLGFITNRELYTDSGMSKKYHNIVWNDIKSKMETYSNSIFGSIEKKLDEQSENW